MTEELNNRINSIKEVLSNMPKNNKKNKLKYIEYLSNILKEYQQQIQELEKEIKARQDKILIKIKQNTIDFSNINIQKKEIEEKLVIVNQYNTPYEKINLDKTIYEIMHLIILCHQCQEKII